MANKEEIKISIAPTYTNNDLVTLVALRDGKEHGQPFTIGGKSFMKSFQHKTAKPEGLQDIANAKFQVKKK